jgi:hypothetical protein
MLALVNQKQQWTEGQGPANPTLYKLASDPAKYSSAFHDVVQGNNNCTAGTTYCGTTTTGFTAAAGYDQATGLGSVDLANLVSVWPANTAPLLATTTSLSAASNTPDTSANDVVTIKVAEAGGSGVPTGTVNLSIDGGGTQYNNNGSTQSVAIDNSGSATYTANFATSGPHTIVARYAGDATHAPSTGSVVLTVGGTGSGKGSFTLGFSPSTLTITRGSQGNETLTVTPTGGYTGTVNLTYGTSNDTALANLCVLAGTGISSTGTMSVTGTTAVSGTVVIDTKASDCLSATGGGVIGHGLHVVPHTKGSLKAGNNTPSHRSPVPAGIALAGLFFAGFLGRKSRKLRQLACVVALASLGLMLSACGGGVTSTGSNVSNPTKGTYTITFSGQDASNAAITAQSSFTLVIN